MPVNLTISRWRSVKTRLTLLTLGAFLLSLWSLAYYATRMLREDMQAVLGDQQFATVSFMATKVNSELVERLRALDTVAARLNPRTLGDSAALQAVLEQQPVLLSLFSGGVIVLGLDGTAIADYPSSTGRVGVNFMERDHIVGALRNGKAMIGKPFMGKKLRAPIFGMATPIRDNKGQVIGAIAGVTDLGVPNFLDNIAESRPGKTGGFLMIAPQHRLVVTATDKSRIMEAVPARGKFPAIDRWVQGAEGTAVFVNPVNVESLASVKRIPVAGWFLVATLPTAEAFAPICAMQQRMALATLLLTLLAGAFTWWLVKRQLTPLLGTVAQLVAMSNDSQPLQALPITSPDEIGQLIGGFNHLIQTLGLRESALREREAFSQAILNSVSAEIAVLDRHGVILDVNQPWQLFAIDNGTEPGNPAPRTDVGTNYLAVCAGSNGPSSDGALCAREGILAVLNGSLPSFSLEYPCHSPGNERWFSMNVTPLGPDSQGVVISHTAITQRRKAQAALQSSLLEKEALLKEVHHRVKNNLQVINSLLRLESGRAIESGTRSVLGEMQGRIRSMALLHESLYRSGTLAAVDLGAYLQQLSTQAFRALATGSGAVSLQLELASIPVGMDQAMPCGLLVNELISNSLKHGFPDGRSGEVRVTLQALDDGARVYLRVSDTGVGLPDDFEAQRGHSLGLQLVSDLAAQLEGVLEIGPAPAAAFSVTFLLDVPKLR